MGPGGPLWGGFCRGERRRAGGLRHDAVRVFVPVERVLRVDIDIGQDDLLGRDRCTLDGLLAELRDSETLDASDLTHS